MVGDIPPPRGTEHGDIESVRTADFEGLTGADLSPWFNPFLAHFVRETLRCGGQVRVVRDGDSLAAVTLHDSTENVTSLFTRSRPLAERLLRDRGTAAAYSDFRIEGPSEPYGVFVGALRRDSRAHHFRHSVRRSTPADVPRLVEMVREVHGVVDPGWFDSPPPSAEVGFVVEVGSRLAGAGWVAVVGRSARLHSLTVRPAFRRIGLGADLLFARLLWAQTAGAAEVVSEVADRNVASVALARSVPMNRVGELFLYPPLATRPAT
jgi:GNAT superfamily N-acetyltransferase